MIPHKLIHALSVATMVFLASCARFDTSGLTPAGDADAGAVDAEVIPDALLDECSGQPAGTPCGDLATTDCSDPDTCDGDGACLANHQPDAQSCDDCAAGSGFCDSCSSGVCQDIGCSSNVCQVATDCAPAVTGGTCSDDGDDCHTVYCMGGMPSVAIDPGAPDGTNFNNWQVDDETFQSQNVSYCNLARPVPADGVLTDWSVRVSSGGGPTDPTFFMVIRCASPGDIDDGPPASDCTRVARGPDETIFGPGISEFSLAGSTQLDGAPANANGVVVQAGDIICVFSEGYHIGLDCNGDSANGDCPGLEFPTQWQFNLATRGEPFGLEDSQRQGVMMFRALGATAAVDGLCTDGATEADGTTCDIDGGDTCCGGSCVAGPGGPGTCQ